SRCGTIVSSRDGSENSGGVAASSRQLTGGGGGGEGPCTGAGSSRQLTGGAGGPAAGPRRPLRRGSGGTSTPSGSAGRRCAPASAGRLVPLEPLRGRAGAALASVLRPSLAAGSPPVMGVSLAPASASTSARRVLERPLAGARLPRAG